MMITLREKLKKEGDVVKPKESHKRISIRDKLLVKEVQEMEQTLPTTCQVNFQNPNRLHEFNLLVTPDEGYWAGGRFLFHVIVPEEYNMAPPKVKCLTKLWHPNICENGNVCLSILRERSLDEMGWTPTRKLNEVVWGISSLFTDLLNFDDPLNREAADLFESNRETFKIKVRDYVNQYARR